MVRHIFIGSLLFIAVVTKSYSIPQCGGQRDIVFLFDMSGSVGSSNFQRMLDFAGNIVRKFYIGQSATQFGVEVFSTSVRTAFRLNDYSDETSLLRALTSVHYGGGWTNTYLGLDQLRQYSFSSLWGHRPGVPKIAVVFTDGKSQDKAATLNAARRLKASGVKVFAVGIGYGIDWEEVNGISSSVPVPVKRRRRAGWASRIARFKNLSQNNPVGRQLIGDIVDKACNGESLDQHSLTINWSENKM